MVCFQNAALLGYTGMHLLLNHNFHTKISFKVDGYQQFLIEMVGFLQLATVKSLGNVCAISDTFPQRKSSITCQLSQARTVLQEHSLTQ